MRSPAPPTSGGDAGCRCGLVQRSGVQAGHGPELPRRLIELLGVVVQVEVPYVPILIAVPVAILLAIAIAALPSWAAMRTRPAEAVRAE